MTIYWKLWWIGWIFVAITRLLLCFVKGEEFDEDDRDEFVEDKPIAYRVVSIMLIFICITLVGGIANGLWLGNFLDKDLSFWSNLLIAIVGGVAPVLLTYLVGVYVLGLYKVRSAFTHIIFLVVLIVSVVLWSISITNYNQNVEHKETTRISSTDEYDLYYFCNIPVQQITGNIDGSFVLGTGGVSGNISTSEELSYWYDDGTGNGLYDSVNVCDSKIIFIEQGETPFVRIITHCKKKMKMDNNVGKETVTKEEYWKTYEFHLPKEIMQYNIG